MILKAVSLFLVFILVLGMFGKLSLLKPSFKKPQLKKAKKCSSCGAFLIGNGPCACGKKRG